MRCEGVEFLGIVYDPRMHKQANDDDETPSIYILQVPTYNRHTSSRFTPPKEIFILDICHTYYHVYDICHTYYQGYDICHTNYQGYDICHIYYQGYNICHTYYHLYDICHMSYLLSRV